MLKNWAFRELTYLLQSSFTFLRTHIILDFLPSQFSKSSKRVVEELTWNKKTNKMNHVSLTHRDRSCICVEVYNGYLNSLCFLFSRLTLVGYATCQSAKCSGVVTSGLTRLTHDVTHVRTWSHDLVRLIYSFYDLRLRYKRHSRTCSRFNITSGDIKKRVFNKYDNKCNLVCTEILFNLASSLRKMVIIFVGIQ